ncbi:MAG: antibiotic biosynthesis monooxygenase [Comamonadaceae bacterium]|nr:MAG: antibiotic biosynthesis monooxygenase [Comamonadaceae bacterium]
MTAAVVIAEFRVRPDSLGDFVELAANFAAQCLESEPGCRRFDVVQLETGSSGVLFYELYHDDAAFATHVASPHLAAFRAAFPPLVVAEKPLRRGTL